MWNRDSLLKHVMKVPGKINALLGACVRVQRPVIAKDSTYAT